jgi:hypothetical protein
MPPNNEIEDFRREIFEAGTHLASLISAAFPDAYNVSTGVACVLGVVEQYGLVGKWVTAHIKHTGEYMITKQIRDVSIIVFSVFRRCISLFQTVIFSSDYSAGRYQLRGKIVQVLRNESERVEGCEFPMFGAPIGTRFGALL